MTGRKCSTCKHYDPAPIWRKGWCRNPLLYSPQQSHLVGEDDLDCERGMGNYWDGLDRLSSRPNGIPDLPFATGHVAPLRMEPVRSSQNMASPGRILYPVSGSSGYRDDPPSDDLDDERRVSQGNTGRQIEYYSEDRYWTDYLRIILPVLGVLLFLVLLYLWALAFLRDDDTPGVAGNVSTPTIPMITAETTPTPQPGTPGTPGAPGIILTPAPIGSTPPVTASTPIPTQVPSDDPDDDIYVGAVVAIANTGGTGANLRSLPTTDSDVVTVLLDGTELEVIDGPDFAQGFAWWYVSSDAETGWVVADYLTLIE
jgi:hypothetical protein